MTRRQHDLVTLDGTRLRVAQHTPGQGRTRGLVVLAHGVGADMNEGGMFARLADRLADDGLAAVRFDYRGHGRSAGEMRGTTIAGEMIDLLSVVDDARVRFPVPLAVVAASFGAVSTLLALRRMPLRSVVLWNPVLDLTDTFVEPTLPWGREYFGTARQGDLDARGHLPAGGGLELGWVAFEEIRRYGQAPLRAFLASDVPALVIHGDHDQAVSYEVAREAARARPDCAFHTVVGSGHGFDSPAREAEAIEVTLAWLAGQRASGPRDGH